MEITRAEFVMSNTDVKCCPSDGYPEYAFIGRSNVGKSSLINMLTCRKNLALTSQTPGKTQLINHFLINKEWYLVDLPGYGYARRGKEGRASIARIIESYILQREAMTNLFVLLDCRHDPKTIDLDFITWLGENTVPFSLVFTKADKISRLRIEDNIRIYREKLLETWEELPPLFVTSSTKCKGREELLAYIAETNHLCGK
ncbi:MAG: ribosome biogenesis GTP-binding protein YihA/YsxC [Tannerellaceae bacterium]|jgi:GTP-binding protein|nr:ribosome biogenesis GTP-binding protein YihA/YsxC [Tannerellaceae bacterium]